MNDLVDQINRLVRKYDWTIQLLAEAVNETPRNISYWLDGVKPRDGLEPLQRLLAALRNTDNYRPCRHCHGTGVRPRWLGARQADRQAANIRRNGYG